MSRRFSFLINCLPSLPEIVRYRILKLGGVLSLASTALLVILLVVHLLTSWTTTTAVLIVATTLLGGLALLPALFIRQR